MGNTKLFLDNARRWAILEALANRSIVLVGMMGSGKTSVGRNLAQHLGLPFVDSDDEIRKQCGMSLDDFFRRYGEVEFRRGEMRVVARLLKQGPKVLATGGGAFCNAETRANIATHGFSIWLKDDPNRLVARVIGSRERPLLNSEDPTSLFLELSVQREPFYSTADLTIELRNRQRDKIVQEILSKSALLIEKLKDRCAMVGPKPPIPSL
jgi:shikimate kinase